MENTTTTTLSAKVAAFKLIARDALRMKLISPRLSKISGYETEIASVNDCMTKIEKLIAVKEFEKSRIDTDHPEYEALVKEKDEKIESLKKEIEEHKKGIEEIKEAIKKQEEGIAKIESGETKVSSDELNALVDQMIEEDALNKVK